MDDAAQDAYLARIGARRPARADAAALRELQSRHLRAVPFENLSIHLGEDISLAERALLDKVVRRRRGGFCYELNGLFAALLTGLGHRVERVSARVHGPDGFGAPFEHLALVVTPPGDASGPWLVDVGFGDHSHHPLRLAPGVDQPDPAGVFRVEETAEGDLDVLRDGRPTYRVERRPRALADFLPTCWWQRTSPDSHFTAKPVCSRLTGDGRVTISGRTLIRTVAGERHEEPLPGDAELLAAYRTHFGVVLDRVP
ncbi:arylamine N-acetyltransferase [Streptomyces capparidis]